jgi:TRAP-type C4-dicarboxylate transport system substrate-binding protein
MAAKLHTVGQKHLMWGYMNDPLIFVVNKDIWNSWTPADRDRQAGRHRRRKEEIAIARKGLVEADKPCSRTRRRRDRDPADAAEREAFVKATRPVYDKWKGRSAPTW